VGVHMLAGIVYGTVGGLWIGSACGRLSMRRPSRVTCREAVTNAPDPLPLVNVRPT
jgi:hypothetical protein